MKRKDPNHIAQIEHAIAEQYGEEAVKNPKSNWNEEKEQKYLEQLKKVAKKENKAQDKTEKVELEGVLINRKLVNRKAKRTCPVCNTYSFFSKDDVYMSKWECCFKCYIQWVQGREKRWKSGWRP